LRASPIGPGRRAGWKLGGQFVVLGHEDHLTRLRKADVDGQPHLRLLDADHFQGSQ
jgi:hypothetical protein